MTVEPLLVLIDFLAVWRLARLVARDDFPPIKRARDWINRRWPTDDAKFPDGEVVATVEPTATVEDFPMFGTLRETGVAVEWNVPEGAWMPVRGHWLGKLVTCIYCTSVWVGFGVMALRYGAPWQVGWWPWLAMVMAASGFASLIDKLDRW